jgi:hypothetical protein
MVMLTNVSNFRRPLFQGIAQSNSKGKDLNRLITAAVINKEFCNMLLTNPERAVASGFNGESFALETEEQNLVKSIRAASLPEFAMQLANLQESKSDGNGRKF